MQNSWLAILLVVVILLVLLPIFGGLLLLVIGLPIRMALETGVAIPEIFSEIGRMFHGLLQGLPRFGVWPFFPVGQMLFRLVLYGLIILLVLQIIRNRKERETATSVEPEQPVGDTVQSPIETEEGKIEGKTEIKDAATEADPEIKALRSEVERLQKRLADLEKDQSTKE